VVRVGASWEHSVVEGLSAAAADEKVVEGVEGRASSA